MCGIYGYYNYQEGFIGHGSMEFMAKNLKHRGPDGTGFYSGSRCGVGNVRLAIIDPDGGSQPFYSDDKKVVLVQNGEIFNYKVLQEELIRKGIRFDSDSDTEILLRLYEAEGISFLEKLNGMFAIAIFDESKGKLILARDRIGEKPLYFHNSNQGFIFTSEIKAFPMLVPREINYSGINAFLRLNYIPAPYTAFKNIVHVMPGTYVEVTEQGYIEKRWWDLKEQEINYHKDRFDWKNEFNSLLSDATKTRLVSDVPFGAFLSGGVDSTSVVGIMAENLEQPVKTYSIGFEDKRFDESAFALQAAKRFKTNHHSKIVEHDIVSEWEKFIHHTDQPHGDVSFMPMRKVSELAVRDVKMALTGDGADELFAGYEKHVPFLSRTDIKDLSADDFTASYMPYLTLLDSDQCKGLWRDEFHDKIDWRLVDRDVSEQVAKVEHFDPINKGLYLDMYFLLVGNNLVKPDRMGMAVSLETRAPFLDYRMMEFAFQMPGEFKLKNGDKKHIYKEAVAPLIGEELAYRKKQMFTVPIGDWLRGGLTEFCHEALLSDTSCVTVLFKRDVIQELVRNHLTGVQNNTREVRALISLEFWMRQFL